MEQIKKILIKNKVFIITLLTCVFLTSSIMVLIYKKLKHTTYTDSSKNIIIKDTVNKEFEPYVTELIDINLTLKKCINGLTIDTKTSYTTLNENISALENLKDHVSSIVVANNTTPNLIPNLVLCIQNTEDLFSYCINVLSYTNNLSSAEITSEILLLKENCMSSYEQLSSSGVYLNFPEESTIFFDNLISYLNTIDKLNKEQSIKTTKYNEYMKTLNTTANAFSKLLEDLQPAIEQIRNDNRSFDILLEDIKTKEDEFLNIKKNFNYSSIPEGCVSYYNCLNNIFKLYSTYLESLKIAVIYEKSSLNYNENKNNIDKNYDNAYSKFEDVKTSFESLLNSL